MLNSRFGQRPTGTAHSGGFYDDGVVNFGLLYDVALLVRSAECCSDHSFVRRSQMPAEHVGYDDGYDLDYYQHPSESLPPRDRHAYSSPAITQLSFHETELPIQDRYSKHIFQPSRSLHRIVELESSPRPHEARQPMPRDSPNPRSGEFPHLDRALRMLTHNRSTILCQNTRHRQTRGGRAKLPWPKQFKSCYTSNYAQAAELVNTRDCG
jgi:hypothetical protein